MHVLNLRNAMADHAQVVASRDGEPDRFVEAVLIQDRAHIEVIGHDQAIESHFLAKQLGDDAMRQCRRHFLRLKAGIPTVTSHHAVDLGDKLAEHGQLFAIQFLTGPINFRQLVVRVDGRGGIAWKMLAAARDPLLPHRVVECPGIANDLFHRFSVTPAA